MPGFGEQQWQAPTPAPSTGFANVFDFSFKKLALPTAAGTIYLVTAICLAVWWVFDVVAALASGPLDFSYSSSWIIGGLTRSVVILLAARVLLELVVFLARIADNTTPRSTDEEQ